MKGLAVMADISATPRTHPVLMAEVRYGIVFGEMNEVFNMRVHRCLLFISIFSSLVVAASAFAAFKAAQPEVAIGIAGVLMVVAAFSEAARRAVKFDERAKSFRAAKNAFQEIEGKGWHMAQNTLEKAIAKARLDAPSGGTWLAALAYNRACQELGHPEVQMHVSGLRRAVGAVAA